MRPTPTPPPQPSIRQRPSWGVWWGRECNNERKRKRIATTSVRTGLAMTRYGVGAQESGIFPTFGSGLGSAAETRGWPRPLRGVFSKEPHARKRPTLCFSALFKRFQTRWKARASGFQMKPGQKGTPCKPSGAGCMGRRRRPGAQPKKKQPLFERLLFLSRAEGSPTLELLAGLEPATC